MSDTHYTKGGDGSHWEGCEETHYDCKIAKLEAELEAAKAEHKTYADALDLIFNHYGVDWWDGEVPAERLIKKVDYLIEAAKG